MTIPNFVRTPDERFDNIPDFDYPPSYVEDLPGYEGLRAHYLDLGPRDASRTFVCLHGEPTWSYVYRKMIPALLHSGARVIVPDFFGFGRSDKPIADAVYGFHFHRNFLLRLLERLAVTHVTLVVQDWGGTIGLTLPLDKELGTTIEGLFIMNTSLPIGEPLGDHFYEWRALVRGTSMLPIGDWMRASTPKLTDAEAAAYDAPFPSRVYQAGPRTFPELAMVDPHMEGVQESRAAATFLAERWSGKTFVAIGSQDPDVESTTALAANVRGCTEVLVLKKAGHFVQEWGEMITQAALDVFAIE